MCNPSGEPAKQWEQQGRKNNQAAFSGQIWMPLAGSEGTI